MTASLLVVPFAFVPTGQAQVWHRHTPRDTVYVPANTPVMTQSHSNFALASVTADLSIWGTFSALPGQTPDSGFDAAYLYSDSAWKAPYPLKNPPMWPTPKGTSYNIYLSYSATGLLKSDEYPVTFIQPDSSYQSSHYYTARVACQSTYLMFRIFDRDGPNDPPNGYYHGPNKGGIWIAMAQHTAGISVQHQTLAFGTVDVGTPKTMLDSIGSYGVDPLQIDTVWIDGSADFKFVSEHGGKFTLPNESTNQFRVIYTPSSPMPAQATLHIHSPNADGPDRWQTVTLTGAGAAPKEEFGTTVIDFNRVRVLYTSKQSVVVNNAGTAPLVFDSLWIVPGDGIFQFLPGPRFVPKASGTPPKPGSQPFDISFTPTAKQKYSGVAYFRAKGGQLNTVQLMGEGAEPIVRMDDMTLDFGTVRTYGEVSLPDTLRNLGNWTADITYDTLQEGSTPAFSYDPPDPSFFLIDGGTRPYSISFHPGTTKNSTLTAKLRFYFDNADTPLTVTLIGREVPPQITYDTNFVNFDTVQIFDTNLRTVGLDNASALTTGFQSTVISSDDSTFRLDKPTPPVFVVGPNTMQLAFHPHRRGAASGWLRINAGGQLDSIFMYGFGARAFPIFNPPVMDYHVVQSGTSNYMLTQLTDTGDYPLNICNVTITGDTGFKITKLDTSQLPCTLPPDGVTSRLFGVTFLTNARTGLPHYGRLEIHYCDGRMDTVQLIATEQAQHVQFTESRLVGLNFGNVHVSATAPANAGLWNGSNVAITIDSIWISPAFSPFTAITPSAAVAATSLDSTIAVAFTPAARGHFSGMLHAREGTTWLDSIPVTGIGIAAVAILSPPDTVNFVGKVNVGDVSVVSRLTLSDTGDWPMKATIVKINDRYNEFVVTTFGKDTINSIPLLDSLGIGVTHNYSVTFSPKHPEWPDHEAQLVFSFDDGTKQTVTLIGHDRSGFLAFDPDTLNFGKVRIGAPPATMPVQLVNTSDTALTALVMQMPSKPFSTPAGPPIMVSAASATTIPVNFTPTVMGAVQSIIVGSGRPFVDSVGSTVVLTGIGAKPIPQFARDTIDFGIQTVGAPATLRQTLSNLGNWPLATNWKITGPNAADFAAELALDTTISEGDSASFGVNFSATTPLQFTPRTATLTFTLDDDPSAQFSVVLIAHDKAPLQVPVGFADQYAAHAGDYIYAYLRLGTAIPDSIGLQHIHGTVTYDPSIIEELTNNREAGSLVPSPLWKVSITDTLGNQGNTKILVYDILSTTDTLRNPGALLKLTFRMRAGLAPGAKSELVTNPIFPDTREAVPITTASVVQLDSLCGQGHFTAGETGATFIEQNNPNPFGASSPTTFLPFDVGEDNTVITIRILDASGREVYRPIDKAIYARGHYSVPISAQNIGSGSFFYEFEPQGLPPQIKKMTVQ